MEQSERGRDEERRRTGVGRKEVLCADLARPTVLDRADLNPDGVGALKDGPWNAPTDELHRSRVLLHLVDGQDAVADELGLGRRELGEDETRAVAERDLGREVERLEVLGLSRGGRDRDALGAEESVDGGRLADVRVPDEADDELGRGPGMRGIDEI